MLWEPIVLKVKNFSRRFYMASTFFKVGGAGSGGWTHYVAAKD